MLLECYFLLLTKRTSSFCSSFPSMCGTVPIQATSLYKEHWLMIQNSRQALLSQCCYLNCLQSFCKDFSYSHIIPEVFFRLWLFQPKKEWINQKIWRKMILLGKKIDFPFKNVLKTNFYWLSVLLDMDLAFKMSSANWAKPRTITNWPMEPILNYFNLEWHSFNSNWGFNS